MKRKVVEQGGVTLMLSLPRKWTKKHSLKKGDEIEIQEKDRDLIISPAGAVPETERYHIDLTDLPPLINFGLSALFIRGVDELEIVSKNPEYIEKLQEKPISQFIGYEIIEQSKNRCLVKDLSGSRTVDDQYYPSLFRRIFLLLISQGEEIIKAVEEQRHDIGHVVSIDLNINRFCFHCMRMLNKYGYTEYRHTPTMFHLVALMEDLGDTFKDMADHIAKNKVTFTPQQTGVMKRCYQLLKDYQPLFFRFDAQQAALLDSRYRKLQDELEETLRQTRPPTQLRGMMHWRTMSDLIAKMLRNQLTVAL